VKNLASAEKPDAVEPKERVSPKVQPPRKAEAPVSSVLQAKSSSASAWDDKSPFVDLPKSIIKSLRIAGLAPDGGISAEAVTLFGLKPEEEKAVRALYDQMKLRFEQVERANFARTEPGKNSFVIRAFPEQATALQQEWTEKLKELVGKNRGELLDDSIRTQASPFPLMGRGGGRGGAAFADPAVRIAGFLDRGQDWFRRGTAEVQITISPGNPGRDGQPTYRIESRTQGEGGGGGSWSGRPDQAPERWRHLLTPDVLGVSLNL
jgi:hypothetical protein